MRIGADRTRATDNAIQPGTKITLTAATSTELVAANDSIVEAYITNTSGNELWIAFGDTAVAGEGVLIPDDGTYICNTFTGQINGIITAGGDVAVAVL